MSIKGESSAQKYRDAAARIKEGTLTGQFGSTGVDFAELNENVPRTLLQNDDVKAANMAEDPNMRGVLGGYNDSGNQRSVLLGLMSTDNKSVMANNMVTADSGMGGSGGKRNESDERRDAWDRLLLLQQQLAQRITEINAQIKDLREKIATNNELIAEIKARLAPINELREKIADHFSGKKRLEVNEDGTFKDEKMEAAVSEYERRTGKKIDRKDPKQRDELLVLLAEDLQHEAKPDEDQLERLEKENRGYQTEVDKLETKKVTLETAQSNLETAISTGDLIVAKEGYKEAVKTVGLANVENSAFDDSEFNNMMNEGDGVKVAAVPQKTEIDLNTSVASVIDQQTNDVRLKGNFNVQAQQTAANEIIQDKSLAARATLNS